MLEAGTNAPEFSLPDHTGLLKELPHSYFEENQLHAFILSGMKDFDDWTHNKAIQKSVESRRITEEQKDYLKSLKKTRRQDTCE